MTWVFPGLFVLLWSTGFIGAKLGLPYADPIVFLELRFLFVLAILLPLCWLSHAPWPSPRRAVQMAVSGGLLQAGYLGGHRPFRKQLEFRKWSDRNFRDPVIGLFAHIRQRTNHVQRKTGGVHKQPL
jgi:hypothetical protein